MNSLENKVVVITGASRGIGEETARLFAVENSKILLAGRNRKRLELVKKSISTSDNQIEIVVSDIRKYSGMKKIVTTAMRKFKRIDIFINNAGVGINKQVEKLSEKEFDIIFDTNLKSVFYSFKELIPIMKKQKGGHIINISSMAGRFGVPGISAYSASKAALNTLSEGVASEVRNDNVKISVLAPASTDTKFMSNMSKKSKSPSKASNKLTATEVADSILYLAMQNQNAWTSMTSLRPLSIKK